MLLGNAAAPRWHDGRLDALDRYIGQLKDWGATAVELLPHHGPIAATIERSHVMEPDWESYVGRYIARGLRCALHASLDGRFRLERWAVDHEAVQAAYLPVLRLAAEIGERQAAPCPLVLHGAVTPDASTAADLTASAVGWMAERMSKETAAVRFAVELRTARADRPGLVDANRAGLLRLVERIDAPSVGICWDLAHDWENGELTEESTSLPEQAFLAKIIHVHAHDADADRVTHQPLVFERVPLDGPVATLAAFDYQDAVTLEVRYRYAAALGDPLALLARSFARAGAALAHAALMIKEEGTTSWS